MQRGDKMPKKQCGVALLAAGKGTRLKLPMPKAIAPLLGQTLIDFSLQELANFSLWKGYDLNVGLVLGHGKELVEAHLSNNYSEELKDKKIEVAHQAEQNGTGHALQCFFNDLPHYWDYEYTLISCVDTPLIIKEIYEEMFQQFERNADLQGVAVSFETNPFGYGRIKREDKGFTIIEEKDANAIEKEIREVNSGLYLFKTSYIKKYLGKLTSDNNAGEFYLTDLFRADEFVKALPYRNDDYFLGINDPTQLERAGLLLKERKISAFRDKGVYIEDSKSLYIDWDVEVEAGSTLSANTYLKAGTRIAEGAVIESGTFLKNSKIGKNTKVLGHSYLEDTIVHENASIGPFARLRPGAEIGNECKVGNFVEIKKAKLEKGAKVSHLSYVGDATIGENSNIGCGFITCNYDGANKHFTEIGSGTFVGSDCQMIAPVKIGNEAFIAAGSTINKDVPDGGFAIARGKQETREGLAKKYLKTKDK